MKPLLSLLIISIILQLLISVTANRSYKNLYGKSNFHDKLNNVANALIGGLTFLDEMQEYEKSETPDRTPRNGAKYDFIIVGAGTAGATLAARLTEAPDITVLLIEAGPSETLLMDVPLPVNVMQFTDINWNYLTEPSDNYCRGLVNKSCKWPRGKVMGGSSVLNYMIATRGHPKDYDRWSELGNDGWSWKEVLPYFIKLETAANQNNVNGAIRGDKGPVYLEQPPFHTPLAAAFIEAGLELGYNISDYNSFDYEGFSYFETTIKNGMRISSNVAYLHPARNRENLFVTKNSLVSKILFDNVESTRAIGVEFIKRNKKYRVYARKEVILSAGTIGSAQLLMLSGIGPAKDLKHHGIKIIADAPVGDNLMDHIACGALVFEVNQPVGVNLIDMMNPMNPYLSDYVFNHTGPLAIPGGTEALAFIDVDSPPGKNNSYPNVELLFACSSFATIPIVRSTMGVSNELWSRTYGNIKSQYSWTIFPMLLRPKSKGKIQLKSNSIYDKPRIYANYMTDKEDVRILVAGVRAALKIAKSEAMQKFGTQLYPTPLAGCEHLEDDSDLYWECATRTITMNIYHYSGTCKMGPKGDKTAVVDPTLKVYGVEGLRVGDASIMPEIISGHTNIPTFMIAEKLADMIKKDWGILDAVNN